MTTKAGQRRIERQQKLHIIISANTKGGEEEETEGKEKEKEKEEKKGLLFGKTHKAATMSWAQNI